MKTIASDVGVCAAYGAAFVVKDLSQAVAAEDEHPVAFDVAL